VLGLVAAGSVAACAFVIGVLVHKGLAEAGLWAGVVAALAGVVAAAAAAWVLVPRPSRVPLPQELEVPDWVVGRPAELTAVVRALVGGRAGTVGITTGLYGAGGFGKTTLAQMVCADQRVRRWFGGRVYLVTVGRDVRGAAAVAAKVNDVIRLVTGEDAAFADPQLAPGPTLSPTRVKHQAGQHNCSPAPGRIQLILDAPRHLPMRRGASVAVGLRRARLLCRCPAPVPKNLVRGQRPVPEHPSKQAMPQFFGQCRGRDGQHRTMGVGQAVAAHLARDHPG
jgi:hypothetical protein